MQENKTERVPVMWEPSIIKEIDDYRFEHRIGTRAEAIRSLARLGLKSTETKKSETPA